MYEIFTAGMSSRLQKVQDFFSSGNEPKSPKSYNIHTKARY